MDRIMLILTLTFFINLEVNAKLPSPFSRYYVRVPESEAHSTSGSATLTAFDPQSIKVFVWNIKKAQLNDWQQEFTQYGEGQDLFLLQEAYQNERFNSTLEFFPQIRWDMGISFLYKKYGNIATGSMIGSEVYPSEVIVKLTKSFEPVLQTPKAMTMAKYPIHGESEELLVISIHGINFTGLKCFKDHISQAVAVIKAHKGAVLFAGDFNTHNNARTRYLMNQMKLLNLSAVEFKNGHQRMKFYDNYLDHGFIRGLKVKHAEVLGNSRGSDHKPMTLELALTPAI